MRKLKNEELVRKSIKDFKTSEKAPLILILDNVRSLNNIGSIFRISDAFLIEKIILCGITACPPHKDIHKTALGSTESVSWEYYSSTIQAVKKLTGEGKSVWQLNKPKMRHNYRISNQFLKNRIALFWVTKLKELIKKLLIIAIKL